MAKSIKDSVEIENLIRRSAAARLHLGLAHRELKRNLDLPTQLKRSIIKKPGQWVGGGLAAGLLSSFLLKKRKKKNASLIAAPSTNSIPLSINNSDAIWLRAVKLIVKLAKPAAKVYATKLIKDFLQTKRKA